MRYHVEVEYWRVEVFKIEARNAEQARVKAIQRPFRDLLGGEFNVLICRPWKDAPKVNPRTRDRR